MSRKPLYNAIDELCRSINLLHSNGLLLPAMMMTYATIDILSSLACPAQATESQGSDFRNWVNRYLLPDSHLCCTADDLWGARCGLLHTYTPNSTHSLKKKAQKVLYIAGVFDESMRNTAEFNVGEYIVVVSQDLFNALNTALCRFIADLEKDAELEDRVTARAGDFLASITTRFTNLN